MDGALQPAASQSTANFGQLLLLLWNKKNSLRDIQKTFYKLVLHPKLIMLEFRLISSDNKKNCIQKDPTNQKNCHTMRQYNSCE